MDKGFYYPIRLLCAVLFCIFSLVYCYVYQADVLAAAQQVASEGKTHYNMVIGAFIITLSLQLLQVAIYGITKLYKRHHALTYLPSLLCLRLLVAIPDGDVKPWLYVALVILVVWCVLVWGFHGKQPFEEKESTTGLASKAMICNLMWMVILMFFSAWSGGKTDYQYLQYHTARTLNDNVRAFSSERDTIINPHQKEVDHHLMTLLMERRLYDFAHQLPRYYDVSQPIPRTYAEAIVLNMSLTQHPQVYWRGSYEGKSLNTGFQEFMLSRQRLMDAKTKKAPSEYYTLYEAFRKQYRDTYWYYYFNS